MLLPPRVGLHDASRIEWSVSLALPRQGTSAFEIELDMAVPSNSYAQHSPWGQLQAFARLDAQEAPASLEAPTLDDLRRAALALAGALTASRDQFRAVCREFDGVSLQSAHEPLTEELCRHVEAAVRNLEDARLLWLRAVEAEPSDLGRERRLADEYLSVRMTDILGACERALQKAFPEGRPDSLESVHAMLTACVGREMAHRRARHFCSQTLAALTRWSAIWRAPASSKSTSRKSSFWRQIAFTWQSGFIIGWPPWARFLLRLGRFFFS